MKKSSSRPTSSSSRKAPLSNNENDISFGNHNGGNRNVAAAVDHVSDEYGGNGADDGDYLSNNYHQNSYSHKQQLLSDSSSGATNNNMTQQQQYVQINQGGQVHTAMTRQPPPYHQQNQPPQQRQDTSNNRGTISRLDSPSLNNNNQLEADNAALSQKNHRLAKELSDLRVRHREENKVVSRLTMENMNLASRCREAISHVAALKKQIVSYEKRHADFGNLQKEVVLLRRQVENAQGGDSGNRNGSTSPKGAGRCGSGSGGVGSNDDGTSSSGAVVDEKKKKKKASSSANATTLETKNSSGSETDLDRIMSQQFLQNGGGSAVVVGLIGSGGGGGHGGEKKDCNHAMVKKIPELTSSTILSKRSITPTPPTSSDNNNISCANTKIPISVTSSSNSAVQKDDEFDAEIDMVDFFAKSQASVNASSNSTNSNNNIGADGLPSSVHHTRSHITHKLKKKTGTDDHMPAELVGGSDRLSPSTSKKNVGDNLLSSLDAFEASFASAFPETSFSINNEKPSSTQLEMSFDIPDFDPFVKSPFGKERDSMLAAAITSSPKSKSSSSGVAASGNKDGMMKSQMKDLFPESTLTSPIRGLDLTFDSTFPDMDIGGGSNNHKSKGKSISADKLDSAFSRAHSTTPFKASGGVGGGKSSSNRTASSSTSVPTLDMKAEIQQLDALASATEKSNGGDKASSSSRTRSTRNVKTPLSYAEPSTKQKLRRGDVLFPKIDADRKIELESKRTKSAGGSGGSSPTTELDRIMSEHFSISTNKKDGLGTPS